MCNYKCREISDTFRVIITSARANQIRCGAHKGDVVIIKGERILFSFRELWKILLQQAQEASRKQTGFVPDSNLLFLFDATPLVSYILYPSLLRKVAIETHAPPGFHSCLTPGTMHAWPVGRTEALFICFFFFHQRHSNTSPQAELSTRNNQGNHSPSHE